jgi:hypothetical protein
MRFLAHFTGSPPLHGDFDVKSKIWRQAPLSFGRNCDVMSGTHGHILAALRSLRQTPPLVPPVADGPGVSLISACGDGKPEAIPRARRGPV